MPLFSKQTVADRVVDAYRTGREAVFTPENLEGGIEYEFTPEGLRDYLAYTQQAAVTPQMFGTIGEGNDHTVLQEFVEYVRDNGVRGIIPPGTYDLSEGRIDAWGQGDIDIYAVGAIFDGSDRDQGDGAASFLLGEGNAPEMVSLGTITGTANANSYTIELTAPNAALLAKGDIVVLQNTADYSYLPVTDGSYLPTRTYYKAGFMREVKDITTTTITFTEPLSRTYATAGTIEVKKFVNLPKIRWIGGKFLGNDEESAGNKVNDINVGINITCAKHIHIQGVETVDTYGGALVLRDIFHGSVYDLTESSQEKNRASVGTDFYGITLIGCHRVSIINPYIQCNRHGVTFTGGGGSTIPFQIPNYKCKVIGGFVHSQALSLDMHGHCDGCSFEGVDVVGGIQVGGRNTSVINCNVMGLGQQTSQRNVGLALGEMIDCNLYVDGLRIRHHVDQTIVDGAIGMDDRTQKAIREGGNMVLKNIDLELPATATVAGDIRFSDAFTSKEVSLVLDIDNHCDEAAYFRLTMEAGSESVFTSADIKIRQIALNISAPFETLSLQGDVDKSQGYGIVCTTLALTDDRRQYINIHDSFFRRSTEGGMKFINQADNSTLSIADTVSMNNDFLNTGSAGFKNSLSIDGYDAVTISGIRIGDDRVTPTQNQHLRLENIDSLFIDGVVKVGTLADADVVTSVVYAPGSMIKGSKTHDFGSVSANSFGTSTTVTVTGAGVGDIATAAISTNNGMIFHCTVTAADTVTVYPYNPTGAPIDLSSGTLTANVRKV